MTPTSDFSDAKRALLEQRLRGAAPVAERVSAIPPRPSPDTAPLSFAQMQMWVIDQLTPGNPAYNLPNAYRLRGALDVKALETAFNAVIARHEALRTTFVVDDDQPTQRIHRDLRIKIGVTSLEHLPPEEREAEAQALASTESSRPFDLSRPPLVRVSLFRLSDTEHVVLITLHHIVADGLSIALLLDELDKQYRAAKDGSTAQLAPLPAQYPDFAAWQQRKFADDSAYDAQVEFWRAKLGGTLPVMELPADMPRPAFQSFRGSNVFFSIPQALTQELKAVGARAGCTYFMTVLAAFQVLLHRYSGADDIIVGTPVGVRGSRDVEPLIGNFLNMAALRGDLSGDPIFTELLRRARGTTLDAFSNGDVPFESLIRRLRFERDPQRNPVFQVLLQVMPTRVPHIGGLETHMFHFDLKYAQFDLSLHLYEEDGAYHGRFEYCADLFEEETIQRLSASLTELLRAIVRNPQERISKLPVLSADDRQRIVHEWNDTRAEFPADARLHTMVEAQARKTPNAIALEFDGQELTYAEFNARANQLARALRAHGVGPDVAVGVLAERSLEMVVSLLAVLKAGGAYVPLDPSYPAIRLRHVLEDARPKTVLSQLHLVDRLPDDVKPVLLDATWAAYEKESSENLEPVGTPDSLCYVIFTSGSTGRPKGAMNTHRGICNRLHWGQREYHMRGSDRVLQKTPFSFDVSVWELFWPLVTGARLVIAMPESHKDSAYLVQCVRERMITTMHFVPSMLRVFLDEEGVTGCRSLKRVFCSGEALPRDVQDRFFALLPDVELHNLYGPAETSIEVTYWECNARDGRTSVPIGRPVANTSIYVLDRAMEPVPVGVPGELYIGGVQVGRGYMGRDDLTAERFVPDPFSATPDARMYRTGDLVRFVSNGVIEYLGRLDHQVKVRGQRIELAEIEAMLDKHASVSQSVVVAREHAGDLRLVAYVVLTRGAELTPSEARKHLRKSLPEYMVPGIVVPLTAFPLTSSGKVDRKALPDPFASVRTSITFEPPQSPAEETVAAVWRELLHVDVVGRRDNFFELGGHSLLALRAVHAVRVRTGTRIDPRRLFFQTLAQVAASINEPPATD
ncbi:MAG TPA: amino acid adenylation domain-containing protein [Gemmatimonadaceae bacterium]|nr:amino acid adenylation domain-containing protein [Gemmatimonadaceae bacterium]